jgi:outer membrane protein assembly factor BamB
LWNETVIVGDASGSVSGLSVGSGEVQWKFKSQGAVYSTPAVAGGLAVFASTDGTVYALKSGTGKEKWRYHTKRPIVASPAIGKEAVFLGSSEGTFRALELTSGKLLWQFENVGGFVETKPLLYEGEVIFGAWDEHLYALDEKTGRLIWKWKGDKPGVLFSPAACWPVAANGRVFIAAPDRYLTALNAKTGAQLWRSGAHAVRESIGISEDQSRFYVRTMQDFFYAFSTADSKPVALWELKANFGYDINSAMLVEKGGTLFYGTKNGVIFALDGKTGKLKWQHKLGVALINTLLPLNGRQVLATDFDGRVALVESKL